MFDALQRQCIAPGGVIFREGEGGDCAYVIESGSVEITAGRGGGEVVLARLRAGDLFGEMALIDDKGRSATARASEDTTLIVIRREQVLRKIDAADPLISLFLRVVLRRLRRTTSLVGEPAHAGRTPSSEDTVDDTGFRRLREQAIGMIERELRLEDALGRGEFEVFFQPVVGLGHGHAAGFEALLRWRQPDGSLLLPGAFIALAEEAELMAHLTRVVLEQVCRAVAPLADAVSLASPTIVPYVSFNLSTSELAEASLVSDLLDAVRRAEVDPARLQVEVTESVLMADPARAARVLHTLKARGISVSVDDFGTGYSSLAYLQRLPIDALKIDRSFVAALPESASSRKIVRAVSLLAHEMGLVTVAEGVERPEELELVRALGFDLAQGFLFSAALPLGAAVEVAARRFAMPAGEAPGEPAPKPPLDA